MTIAPTRLLTAGTPVTEAALLVIAHLPTTHLPLLMDDGFAGRLQDADLMRIAVLLAEKSRREGGCPIGAVVVDDETGWIVGKGHNTLVQDGDPYNHGETAAMRDAGRIDYGRATLFTSLSPCAVCASLLTMRGVRRVVVGDVTNASGSEDGLRAAGVTVDVLEDPRGVEGYRRFREAEPALESEDWKGVAGVRRG